MLLFCQSPIWVLLYTYKSVECHFQSLIWTTHHLCGLHIFRGNIIICCTIYMVRGNIIYIYVQFRTHTPQGGGVPIRSIAAHLKEFYVDDSFAGGWDKPDTSNSEAVMTRIQYVIKYANCPVLSKLQSEISLSETEVKCIVLSQSIRELIPVVNLLKEINKVFTSNLEEPKFHCNIFEDNNRCIAIATTNKLSPRNKHIVIKYHHFQYYIKMKLILILPIDTKGRYLHKVVG